MHFALAKAVKDMLRKSDRPRVCVGSRWMTFRLVALPQCFNISFCPSIQVGLPMHLSQTYQYTSTNYYVTHDLVPPKIKWLHESGRVIKWTTWGPDGNFPLIDSKEYWLSEKSKNIMKSCVGFVCSSVKERMLVSLWGAEFSSSEIERTIAKIPHWWQQRRTSRTLHFVGSVWHGNTRALPQFKEGCGNEVTLISPYSAHETWFCRGFLRFMIPQKCTRDKYIDDAEFQSRTAHSFFTPAVQGRIHLNGYFSYIPDRVLNGAAVGQVIATNNPAVVKLLADHPESVVYRENINELCQAATAHVRLGIQRPSHAVKLARFIQRQHTYEQRLSSLLKLFWQLSSERDLSIQ